MTLENTLAQHFGWNEFRPLQREVIECILAGKSALTVLPTGGGKSLCYQLPALMLPGITVVISPLISLMKDQVDALVARDIAAVAVNSHDTLQEMRRKLADIAAGRIRIVYVAPERLKSNSFTEVCCQAGTSLIAVDEAHCVSQWGHDFRPDYRFISDFRIKLGNPPLLALTATATRRVQEDVAAHLGIERADRFLAGVDRPNLWLGVEHCQTMVEKRGKIVSLVARAKGSVVVYVSSRNDAEEMADMLAETLQEPVVAYHAGMPPDARTAVQNRFMAGLVRVVTATNAFGMGIDKADIRAVIHAGVPESIEGYFQEVGRAGRDGQPAECTLVVVPGRDVKMRQFLLEKDEPTRTQVVDFLKTVSHVSSAGEGVVPLADNEAALGTLILSYLQSADLLELVQRTQAGMQVTMVRPITQNTVIDVWEQVQRQVQLKRERFRVMRNFVYLETCRRSFLMKYFGGNEPVEQSDCCSACHPRPVQARIVKTSSRHAPKADPPVVVPEQVNSELLQFLKEWRRTQADVREVPAYVIFGDKDLMGIAAAAPLTLSELAACRGIGPAKLQMYGQEILAVVASVMEKQRESSEAMTLLFSDGMTVTDVANELHCSEDASWESFLTWIATTDDEIWKDQVRRYLSPEAYVAIRSELRGRMHKPLAVILTDLQPRYGYRQITLSRAVMKRVGER